MARGLGGLVKDYGPGVRWVWRVLKLRGFDRGLSGRLRAEVRGGVLGWF